MMADVEGDTLFAGLSESKESFVETRPEQLRQRWRCRGSVNRQS